MSQSAQTRIALLLIGNELLTGKIRDLNGPHTIDTLRKVGAELVEMRVVSDGQEVIAGAIRQLLQEADWVITSGGIGPTHDDVTMAAVAQALEQDLVENGPLRERIEARFPDDEVSRRVWARMATLPSNCELIIPEPLTWPVFLADRVWILPGVPQTFRKQLDAIAPRFGSPCPTRAATIHLSVGEGIVAEPLEEAVRRFEPIEFGSYPHLQPDDTYHTRVTVEGRVPSRIREATTFLVERFGEHVLGVDEADPS